MENHLIYSQSSGLLYLADNDGNRTAFARGYSGHGTCINDPDAEGFAGRGPIPRGVWKIHDPVDHQRLGPCSFYLTPVGHDAYHRSEFFIHGDNRHGDRSASTGCIILGRNIRRVIELLMINCLEVVL